MNIHEFAKQLLELPEDTTIIYLEEGKSIYTKVEKYGIAKTGGAHLEPAIQEAIKQSLPSTFVIMNVAD